MDVPDEKKTIVLPLWSQFILHDLVHTPMSRTSKFLLLIAVIELSYHIAYTIR